VTASRTCVVLLNWNGWQDTIECLESLFRLRGEEYRVVVCDNASSDDSVDKIGLWAQGKLETGATNAKLSGVISPPVAKPIKYAVLTRREAESGAVDMQVPLTLIQTGGNLGFAGGNNVGLRFALRDPNCQYFWLLNNDTVAAPRALTAMLDLMRNQPEVGLCGSLTLSYHDPEVVQAQGGHRYRRWTARVLRAPALEVRALSATPPRMDYVNGASMLASRRFLETVGLLEESYFLYFEELDWAMRARGRFALGYAPQSVIYHKEGASIGSSTDRRTRSVVSDQYLARSRVLFTRRFFPWALPSVLAWTSFAALYRMICGDTKRAQAMMSALLRALDHRLSRESEAGVDPSY